MSTKLEKERREYRRTAGRWVELYRLHKTVQKNACDFAKMAFLAERDLDESLIVSINEWYHKQKEHLLLSERINQIYTDHALALSTVIYDVDGHPIMSESNNFELLWNKVPLQYIRQRREELNFSLRELPDTIAYYINHPFPRDLNNVTTQNEVDFLSLMDKEIDLRNIHTTNRDGLEDKRRFTEEFCLLVKKKFAFRLGIAKEDLTLRPFGSATQGTQLRTVTVESGASIDFDHFIMIDGKHSGSIENASIMCNLVKAIEESVNEWNLQKGTVIFFGCRVDHPAVTLFTNFLHLDFVPAFELNGSPHILDKNAKITESDALQDYKFSCQEQAIARELKELKMGLFPKFPISSYALLRPVFIQKTEVNNEHLVVQLYLAVYSILSSLQPSNNDPESICNRITQEDLKSLRHILNGWLFLVYCRLNSDCANNPVLPSWFKDVFVKYLYEYLTPICAIHINKSEIIRWDSTLRSWKAKWNESWRKIEFPPAPPVLL